MRKVLLGDVGLPARGGLRVLTPNENAADALGVEPLSLEGLARLMLGSESFADPLVARRLLREATAEVTGSPDTAGLARTLEPVIREIFRAAFEVPDTVGVSDRARRVIEVARTYRRLLRERGLLDGAEALREAARRSPSPRPVLIWGYPRLGGDELAFADAVAGEGSVLRLPHSEDDPLFAANAGAACGLRERGWTVEQRSSRPAWEPEAEVEAYAYPHEEAEMRGVLARIKKLLADGVEEDDVVIVARDDAAHGPLLFEVADEYGVPVRALYRVPVSETSAGSWLELLISASKNDFPFETTCRLLMHPMGPGISREGWTRAREKEARGLRTWIACGADLTGLDLRRTWPGEDSRAGWAERVRAILDAPHMREEARRSREDSFALERLGGALDQLAHPQTERIGRGQFLSEVSELLSLVTVPVRSSARGVALHTPLSLFGARFRHVFAVGLAEGESPAPVSDEPALDFHERRKLAGGGLRLELAGERAMRERLSFWALTNVAREKLVLSYPKVRGDSGRLPSPYFETLNASPQEPPEPLLASPEEARRAFAGRDDEDGYAGRDPVLSRARRALRVELRRESPEPFDEYDGVIGAAMGREERRFSASQISDLARCGFKWWAGRVLELSEPAEGESPASIGSLYHRALEISARRARKVPAEQGRDAILSGLDEAFSEAERELKIPETARSWPLRRREHLELLRRSVAAEQFVRREAAVSETEVSFSGEWRGFQVAGRIDRVDRAPWGVVLVDYKSGSGVPRPDLQLALYREAAAPEIAGHGEEVRDTYYFSLRKAERLSFRLPEEEDLARIASEAAANLDAGNLPPDAVERDPSGAVCEHCPFDLVCRRGPRLWRKAGSGPENGA